jgi:hypothetical protein
MWIRTTLDNRVSFFDADVMNEPIEWSENETAKVTAEVGEALIEKYEHIEEHETNESKSTYSP